MTPATLQEKQQTVLSTTWNQVTTDPVNKSKKSRFGFIDSTIVIGAFVLMITSVIVVYLLLPYLPDLHINSIDATWRNALLILSLTLLTIKIGFLLYFIFLYRKYRPVAAVDNSELPICTVIVPAYNEGELVYHTLMSLAKSDYPVDKIEILAIDDGSKDDTWQWMLQAKAVLGNRLSIYQQPKNMGKRQALYRGFKMGKGEVFVTVDSDSVVKSDTLKNMVSPFVREATCGAVAGNVRVLNNKSAIIPRMMDVSFVFSFEFIRSAQSALGSVLCTPGALSAYRREAVYACIEDWVNQRFMGQVSDIGEDRAMTNMILRQGYNVRFQRNAYVLTNVPENYKGLYKMFIRWERSNVRENIKMSQFAFTDFRKGPKTGPRLLLLFQWFKVVMAYPMVALMLVLLISFPIFFVCSVLAGILVFSSIQVFFYARKNKETSLESVWAYPYAIMYAFALFWITPYAIATARRRGWLTRA